MSVREHLEHGEVEGLRTGRYPLGIAGSCIVYRLGSAVIDTGPPNQWPFVRRFLDERRVQRVFITHHHEDHAGNAARIARHPEPVILAPEASRAPLRHGFSLKPYQRMVWGAPPRCDVIPLSETPVEIDGGCLVPVPAPGHSPDMTCYLEPERGWLFSGDLYIAARPRFARADEDIATQIETLRRVAALEFETMFCAHRGVVHDGPDALRAKLDFLVGLREEVRHLRARGHSVSAIARRLLGRESLMSLVTAFHFSHRNLVRGCLATADG